DAADVLAVRRQLQETHDVDAHALAGLDLAGPQAMRTILVDAALERRPDALAGHLDDAELGNPQDLGAGAVAFDGVAQGFFHAAAVALLAHVDEIIDDDAAEVAEPQLPGDFLGR